VLQVNSVNRNAGAGAPFGTPDPSFHRVILTITFVDQAGDHEVSVFPYVNIKDATGQFRPAMFGKGCDNSSGALLTPGKTLGPLRVCFDARGAPADPITLVWLSSTAGDTQLELRL
jgi:hypothetical protein